MISSDWSEQLEQLKRESLLRQLTPIEQRDALSVTSDGHRLLNFSSNDYLNLSSHPEVLRAAAEALQRWGSGAGASRLVCGTLAVHEALESALAAFKGTEAALVFSSGYLAALGIIQTLSRRADGTRVPLFFDRLAHACLLDAARFSDTSWHSFPHNDLNRLEELLRKNAEAVAARGGTKGGESSRAGGSSPSAIVVTEGVFSMDGDMAPLRDCLALCERWGAVLLVDDAHGTGTIGPGSRGSAAQFGLPGFSPCLIQLGTLSKALGSQGGFVAGPRVLMQLVQSRARSFIFDTALAPASAAAALAALQVIEAQPGLAEGLQYNARLLRTELREKLPPDARMISASAGTPIVPVLLGDPKAVLKTSADLKTAGFLAVAIRPPTVPQGTSRIRLTVTAGHTAEQIAALAEAMAKALSEFKSRV